jgi:uncharacterized protein
MSICAYYMMKEKRRGRPTCRRIIEGQPEYRYFKPAGVPVRFLREIQLTVDEFEALRLADAMNMYQDEAAQRMGVSRATFGRIVASARRKTAEALLHGHALRIEGGTVMENGDHQQSGRGNCICPACGRTVPHKAGMPCRESRCPSCDKPMLREGSAHHQALLEKRQSKTTGEQS